MDSHFRGNDIQQLNIAIRDHFREWLYGSLRAQRYDDCYAPETAHRIRIIEHTCNRVQDAAAAAQVEYAGSGQ
ncbi:MAG: hypothetical protein ACP5LD_00375 [Desulfomonilaceae bacterium]